MTEVEKQLRSIPIEIVEEEAKAGEDDFHTQDLFGFSGNDILKHQDKMIEELQLHKYNLVKAGAKNKE